MMKVALALVPLFFALPVLAQSPDDPAAPPSYEAPPAATEGAGSGDPMAEAPTSPQEQADTPPDELAPSQRVDPEDPNSPGVNGAER
jgi:hypothetical protein